VVSFVLVVLTCAFAALCFVQLSGRPGRTSPSGAQAAFAIAGVLQVVLVGLASTIIFASWRENRRLIRFSVYSTVVHLVTNLIALACLWAVVASIAPCWPGQPGCLRLVVAKPVWVVLSICILLMQLYLFLVVFSYHNHLLDHSRRPYIPETSSRNLSGLLSPKGGYKGSLSGLEVYSPVELHAVESRATTTRSLSLPEPESGYGGGLRTYEQAEENEKERLRREMESEGDQGVSFPIASPSEPRILTPLGLEWRDGDLPPYAYGRKG